MGCLGRSLALLNLSPLRTALVPFFADQFRNAPEIMPKEKGSPQLWFPTLALTLQFVAKFPLGFIPGAKNSAPSNKTVGLYSTSTWMNEGELAFRLTLFAR